MFGQSSGSGWLAHSPSLRVRLTARVVLQVLQNVRLPLLSPKFLVGTVGSDPLIKSDEECRYE